MPFITQGKTNLTYLLIVVILAVIVGGGILGYYYQWIVELEVKLIGLEYRLPVIETPIDETVAKKCVDDDDCAVFGETGDCNCGCFNKNHTGWERGGDCFCAAPTSCKCVAGRCEAVF